MFHIQVRYSGHIVCITGKISEIITTEARNLGVLIKDLDRKYPGLEELFNTRGIFNLRTMVHLRRIGEPPRAIPDPNFQIRDGDIYLLW